MTLNESDDLVISLRATYERLRSEMRDKWQRDLPLNELLFDRWERASSLGFGEGTSVYHSSYIYGDVRIGSHTWVGPFTLLDGSGGLTIGDFCNISAGAQIYTHDTFKWVLTGGKAEYERAAVSIGSCSYIGSQTVITKGVNVGEHCVIGACSFVNRSIPPFSIAVGAPARIIGRVEVEGSEVRLVYTPVSHK